MRKLLRSVLIAVLVLAPAAARAQKPVAAGEVMSETATIVAIDSAARVVTLKDKLGLTMDVVCGPEVQRFDALKVGDQVTFRYHESLVTAISAPGAAKPPVSTSMTRTPGTAPGGTIARQMTATVTITAMDPKVPSVTIARADGNKMSFKVENAANLKGYKVGDKVDITYTQALAVSVTSPK